MRGRIFDNPKTRRPSWFFPMTRGRCFYCGSPMFNVGEPQERDWLFLSARSEAVKEHKTPTIRGGTDDRENLVPACSGCNSAKGAFTLEEFRFARALQNGDMNFRFAFERSAEPWRDWICVHSAEADRALVVHNFPAAVDAYRLRNGRSRSPRGANTPA